MGILGTQYLIIVFRAFSRALFTIQAVYDYTYDDGDNMRTSAEAIFTASVHMGQ